jgi:threonine/homoserine/homoserine lactone efflux protein
MIEARPTYLPQSGALIMPHISNLAIFIVAALVLLITPGPAVLYIVARSIDQGRRAGIVSTLGVGVGSLCHVTAAAFGLSALLVSSVLAFNLVKYLGAVYLIYLGVRKLLAKDDPLSVEPVQPKRLSRLFYQGVWVNLLNPKTTIFFFAFLPQFVSIEQGNIAVQILFLGTLFVVMGICSDSLYALLAGTMGGWLRSSRKFLRGQRYFTGGVFIALGLTAAFSGSGKK